jgi:hypothetical protein
MNELVCEKLSGLIWRMEIDSMNDLLLIEERDQEKHEVSFTSINLQNGKINFKNLKTEDRWSVGIEGAADGVLFLHGYESQLSPTHKGLIAIDAISGKALWTNFHLAVEQFGNKALLAFDVRIQPKKIEVFNYKTGQSQGKLLDGKLFPALTREIVHPDILIQIPGELAKYIEGAVCSEILSSNFNNLRIVSLHTNNNGIMQQHIFILAGEKLIFHDLLNDHIQKLQPEAFVIHKSRLIYIKNHSEIKVLVL